MSQKGDRTFSPFRTEKIHLKRMKSETSARNEPVRKETLIESINKLSGDMNARMSREMETTMNYMQTQSNKAINCALSERIIPEIKNMVENLPVRL